jgi:hypothetical protein
MVAGREDIAKREGQEDFPGTRRLKPHRRNYLRSVVQHRCLYSEHVGGHDMALSHAPTLNN